MSPVPSVFLKWPEAGPDHAIIVDKSLQKIYIYREGYYQYPIQTYHCSTGENEGPKKELNDKKTPEGIYFITESFVKRYLSPIYGVRAFPLNYPNALDEREGRKGYGIWFHGTNKALKPYDTNGCIALENNDIDQMAAYVRLQETPVIILGKLSLVPPENIERDKRDLINIIEKWRGAWEKKDIKGYMSFYSPEFTADGKNWYEWKVYKTKLAGKEPNRSIEIENLLLLTDGKTALAGFTQKYETTSLSSRGIKRLYLKRNSSEWKIFAEKFYGSDFSRSANAEVPLSMQDGIREFPGERQISKE